MFSMSKRFLMALLAFVPSFMFAENTSSAAAAPQQGGFGPIIFLVAILGLMYVFVWRPQQKKAKDHRALVSAVGVEDEILLNSGMVAKVSASHDQYLSVTLGEGVTVLVQRSAISAVLPKGSIESLKKSK